MPNIKIKRIYEEAAPGDGYRILVDRIWPRGLKKEDAHIDEWCKKVAPTTALRKWFNHEVGKWSGFQKKYEQELNSNDALQPLKDVIKKHATVTLLYGAKDALHNQAVVLKKVLSK